MAQTYSEWVESMSGLSDQEVSHRIRDKILESPELDEKSKRLFSDTYEFIEKNADKNKEFKMDMLQTYLKDVKGYKMSEVDIIQVLTLITFCGLQLKTK